MAKKTKRKKLTEKLDGLIRDIIRLRDDNMCQIGMTSTCFSLEIEGSNSHPCHVVAKGRGASLRRFDLLNIFLGCMYCHRWWHENVLDSNDWFKEKFPTRYAYLEIYRGGKPCPISETEMEMLVETYKQKLIELKEK